VDPRQEAPANHPGRNLGPERSEESDEALAICRHCGRHDAKYHLQFSLGRELEPAYKYVEGEKRAVKRYTARRLELPVCSACHRRFRWKSNSMVLLALALFLGGVGAAAGCYFVEYASTPLGWAALALFVAGFAAASLDSRVAAAVEREYVRSHPRFAQLERDGYTVLHREAGECEWREVGKAG